MSEVVGRVALVTGAGGFIGGAAARALAGAGFAVIAGVRSGASTGTSVACDLDRPDEIRAAVAGADVVVHAAYGDVAAMARQSETLLAVMSAARVVNLVALSSIAVAGAREGRVVEADAPEGRLDVYATAKIACERAVRAWAEASPGRRAVLLRPGVVYGTDSRFWIDKLAERIRLGAWGDFGAQGEGIAALIHVDDLAALIASVAETLVGEARAELPPHVAAHAVGPETPSWNAYFAALAAKLGAPPLQRLTPGALAAREKRALAAKLWRKIGLPGLEAAALAPTAGEVALFSRKAIYATDEAARRFGFAPRLGLAEGLARTRFPAQVKA